ncbi:MAG: thioredoxin family protein [Candidatus Aureabacteria bacterium]|nr:thioredoxin family protein [Candidatus Auribacterota bacterium]
MKNFLIFIMVVLLIIIIGSYFSENIYFSENKGFEQIVMIIKKDSQVIKGKLLYFNGKRYLVKMSDNKTEKVNVSEIKRVYIQSKKTGSKAKEADPGLKESPQPRKKLLGNVARIKTISKGSKVNIKSNTVRGYVVVFDFYADWCGPCKVLGPKLEDLIKKYDDVILRKINIDNWGSPVAKQHKITSIPSVSVYDKKGHMVGSSTSNFSVIKKNIEKSRSR